MKISEILRKAADEYLSVSGKYLDGKQRYSCCAVIVAAQEEEALFAPVLQFLVSLGVDENSGCEFSEFDFGMKEQGARFLWLDFAALVAEDEGL